MVTVLALLGVLAVLFAAAVLATRDGQVLADAPPDAADVPLPEEPLQPADVSRLRFSLAARGYRMSEVDLALVRLAAELADRDRRIALLEAAVQGDRSVAPAGAPPIREAGGADLPVAEAVPAAPAPSPLAVPAAPSPPAVPAAPAAVVPPAPAAPVAPAPSMPAAPLSTLSTPATVVAPDALPAAAPADPVVPVADVVPGADPDPDPLPPADLGAELVTQEREEQAAADPQPQDSDMAGHAQNPSGAAPPGAAPPDDPPAALEETGDRPHQP